ncbi:MAG: BrnA antitoxin family protein [Terriglobales bacterium]
MKPAKRVNGGGKRVTEKVTGFEPRARRKGVRGKIALGGVAKGRIASLKASEAGTERKSLTALKLSRRQNKKRTTLFLDADVLAWFKEGPKYQKEINRALREVMRSGRDL